jgi:glyoxylase-like metal-dependent hydrolase (beta-lactamase superfamily II)
MTSVESMARAVALGVRRRQVVGFLLIVLSIVLAGISAARRRGSRGADGDVPVLGPEPRTIVPGVHILGGLFPSAAYVVEAGDGLILIDTGLDADAKPLIAQMGALGLDWRRTRAILLTHVHADHSGGARYLAQQTGAKVYAGAGDVSVLEAGGPHEALFSNFYLGRENGHPTPIDVPLKGGEVIAVGDVRVEALAVPGHTPGSICYLLRRGNRRILFGGDVFMRLRGDDAPKTELDKSLGTYAAYLAPRYRGDAKAFLAALRQLREIPAPDLLLPGHPRADAAPQSPVMTPARWASLIDGGIHDMEELLARYDRDGADFLDGVPKALLPELYYLGDFDGCAVYGLFAGSRLFLVARPTRPGLAGFVRARLESLGCTPATPTGILLTSCDPEHIAGLSDLVAKTRLELVAAREGLAAIEAACPPATVVHAADELTALKWFDATPVAMKGRGLAPVGYTVRLADKNVLFTGGIPIRLTQDSARRLFGDFLHSNGNITDFVTTIGRLQQLQPDLWLPSQPIDGQNANLYGDEWGYILDRNIRGIDRNVQLLRATEAAEGAGSPR